MRALVVYESMFGNTETIANAIADGLRRDFEVEVVEVGHAPARLDADVDLVVIGGPTHAWGMSRRGTRRGIDPPPISRERGVREWLHDVEPWSDRTATATFDTRFQKPGWLTGSAARSARKALARRGTSVVIPAASFFVDDTRGPLIADEQDRAYLWARELAAVVGNRSARITQ